LIGAGVATLDAAGLLAPLELAPAALSSADYWVEQFAIRYPRLFQILVNQAAKVGTGPPVAGTTLAFFLNWMEEHLR
jgi:hypothetical protein